MGRYLKKFLLLLTLSCADIPAPKRSSIPHENLILIATTDFSTGFLSAFSFEENKFYKDILPIHSDAILRRREKDIFIINRLGKDSIVRVVTTADYLPLYEMKLDTKSNPQDMVFIDSQYALVSLHNKNDLLLVDYQKGSMVGKISLEAFLDSDGYTEAQGMFYHNTGFVYVALQRLNRYGAGVWPPSGESYLVKINPYTKSIVRTFVLPFTNPISMRYHGFRNSLLISAVAYFGANYALDGGVLEFDLNSETFSPVLLESDIGEEITDCIFYNNNLGFLLTQDSTFITKVKAFNPTTKTVITTLAQAQAMTGFFSSMELVQNKLFVADRNYQNPKVRVFDVNTFLEHPSSYEGLPPFSLVYMP